MYCAAYDNLVLEYNTSIRDWERKAEFLAMMLPVEDPPTRAYIGLEAKLVDVDKAIGIVIKDIVLQF